MGLFGQPGGHQTRRTVALAKKDLPNPEHATKRLIRSGRIDVFNAVSAPRAGHYPELPLHAIYMRALTILKSCVCVCAP